MDNYTKFVYFIQKQRKKAKSLYIAREFEVVTNYKT
jgi:hypothetical protein